jgi:hypothetical protein
MSDHLTWMTALALAGGLLTSMAVAAPQGSGQPWGRGAWTDPTFFPLAVWLQSPDRAREYQALGINVYVGLWKGPTDKQLATLREAGMRVICHQNDVGLEHRDDPTIIGWLQDDEPDNAQRLPDGQKGYGPPVEPAEIVARYERMKQRDPSRPVLLNLSQGVAWDGWIGRGVRTNHPEDYPEYLKGCDIASFDIYPVVHRNEQIRGRLEYVPRGVTRLVEWTDGRKPVWNCIECTSINRPPLKASPHQIRAQVWMSIIHGSRGLIYFVHQFAPTFNEAALLDDPENRQAIKAINARITALAPALNSGSVEGVVEVTSANPAVPVAHLVKRHAGHLYMFAVAMRDEATEATIRLKGVEPRGPVTVLDEDRTLRLEGDRFTDRFEGYAVHLYQLKLAAER